MSAKEQISKKFKEIMELLNLDVANDDSLQGTPDRVAKMFVNEIFSGLKKENYPKITAQDNKYGYSTMLIEVNIPVRSLCEHHFQPIVGVAHVAYIPKDKLLGLSKFNRIVDYFSRRPQVQEKLSENIRQELQDILKTNDVAVTIDAKHYCIIMRGITQDGCITRTTSLGGKFLNDYQVRQEYLSAIGKVNVTT